MLILWVTWRSFHNFYCKLFASIRCRKWWQHTKLGLVTQKVIRDKEDSFYQSSRIILKIQNALHFCSLLLKIELVGFPSRCQLAVIIWKSKTIISFIDAPIEMKDLNPIHLRDMYISSVYQSLFSLNYEVYGCFNHTFYDIPKFAVQIIYFCLSSCSILPRDQGLSLQIDSGQGPAQASLWPLAQSPGLVK